MESLRALLAEQEDRLTRQSESLGMGGITPKEQLLEWLELNGVDYEMFCYDELGMTGSHLAISRMSFNEAGLVVSCGTLR